MPGLVAEESQFGSVPQEAVPKRKASPPPHVPDLAEGAS